MTFADFCTQFSKVSSDSQNSLGSVSATTEKRTLMKASLASFSGRGNVTFADFCRQFLKVSSDSQNSLGSVSATTEKRTLMKASLASFSDRGNVTPETLADDF